ncbi:ampD N-acetyl-anhydromuramyl-L-alanine amidase [uncultured Caudovirales phage]|uniref:N-acetylmuramoyl-L-alanine amidase n=1 Tax=uncultured Caudovirales phage TaxID=2100421 RepID=A0A6J5N984_9CAUD|nr:ampD N-acetyl-anhydromuramyl-L-alanine amidase [uncultured Caudovirales phage]
MAELFGINAKHLIESVPEALDPCEFEIKFDKVKGYKITPRVIVVHYGVTRSQKELEQALLASDYVSAHVALTARGSVNKVTQLVPTNIQAGHAGTNAVWRGQPNVNSFSLGIEINNPGPLFRGADGLFRDVYGRLWDEEEPLAAAHASGRFPAWKLWAPYTAKELQIVELLCRSWIRKYPSIVDVVGHDEIRRDKADPGPAFPMLELRDRLFGS